MRRIFHAITILVLVVALGAGMRTQAIAEAVEEVVVVEAGAPESSPVEDPSSEGDAGAVPSEGDSEAAPPEEDVEAVVPEDDASEPEDQTSDAALDQDAPDVVTEEDSVTDDEVQPDEPADALEEEEPVLDAQAGGISFTDVYDSTEHMEDILWLAETGISEGWKMGDGTRQFRPISSLKRCDMAAFIFRLARLWGLVTNDWQPTGAASFSDVNGSTSHYREVMWLAETGISEGWEMGDGTRQFRPNADIKRADMAAFLARLHRLRRGSCSGRKDFVDVEDSTPHAADIRWLAASGISTGWELGDGTAEFRPYNSLKRADMAAFLHRLYGLKVTYTIKFNKNGGTGTMRDLTAEVGSEVDLTPNAFSRKDHDFNGWNTKSNGTGSSYGDRASVKDLAAAGESVTLYAQWKKHTYIVKYNANGGVGGSADQMRELDQTFTLNKNPFSREGFIFMAWNTKADGSGTYYIDRQQVTNIGKSGETVILYAQWVTSEYTITYDANGGTGTMADQTATRGIITKLDKLAYRRENHCFTGWNTEPDGSGVFVEPSGYVTNPAPYVTPDAASQEPADPNDPRENSCVKATLSYTDEVTLYAQWRHVTAWYRIDYEANGGTFTADYRNQLEADYQWIDLNTPQPLRAGLYEKYENGEKLVFAGWNTKADGTGVPYANKEVVYNVSGDYDTPDLYAQWERFDEAKFKDKLSTAYNRWRSSNGLNTAERNSYCDGLATASAEGCASRGHLVKGLGMTTINDKMRYRDIVATSTRQLTADELIQLWVADDSDRSGLAHPLASRFGVGVYVDKDNGVYWYALVYNLY